MHAAVAGLPMACDELSGEHNKQCTSDIVDHITNVPLTLCPRYRGGSYYMAAPVRAPSSGAPSGRVPGSAGPWSNIRQHQHEHGHQPQHRAAEHAQQPRDERAQREPASLEMAQLEEAIAGMLDVGDVGGEGAAVAPSLPGSLVDTAHGASAELHVPATRSLASRV